MRRATAIISWFSMRSRSALSLSYPSLVIGERSLDMTINSQPCVGQTFLSARCVGQTFCMPGVGRQECLPHDMHFGRQDVCPTRNNTKPQCDAEPGPRHD